MSESLNLYFWRQSLVLLSDYIHSIGVGIILAYPAILNPAILNVNSTDLRATPADASWIAGSQGFSGAISCLMMPTIMQVFGRKAANYAIHFCVTIGFIIFYFATNITYLYIARLVQGLALSGIYVTSIILAEYSSPKRRGYFISIKKSGVALGSLTCHWLSMEYSWRIIALIGASTNVLSVILTTCWPESPAHLALKGKFKECDKSHTWLNGNSPQAQKELEELISAQSERRQKMKAERFVIKRIFKSLAAKDFRKPIFIAMLLTIVIESCGRYYNIAYIVQIMTDILNDNSVGMYSSLGSDVMTLIAVLCSCFVVTKLRRRTILFTFGFISVVLIFFVSLAIFMIKRNYIGGHFVWLPPCFIALNSFVTNLGVVPMCFTITGEIFPLEHRGTGTCISGIFFTILYGAVLKCTPMMIDSLGVDGVYCIYGLLLFFCLVILYFILIETKDKTLQEIENEVKGIEKSNDLLLVQKHNG